MDVRDRLLALGRRSSLEAFNRALAICGSFSLPIAARRQCWTNDQDSMSIGPEAPVGIRMGLRLTSRSARGGRVDRPGRRSSRERH